MGKEQAPEDVKCGVGYLVSFTDIFYRMDMQEISIQNGQDKAQAVRGIGNQHLRKEGMGMPAGGALYPWDTQGFRYRFIPF